MLSRNGGLYTLDELRRILGDRGLETKRAYGDYVVDVPASGDTFTLVVHSEKTGTDLTKVGSKNVSKPHRIAAGGLTFQDDSVLLVRYRDNNGGTFLGGPGGALEDNENVVQAIIRETKEETGITVQPQKVVVIEDLMCSRFKMSKVWMICEVVDGVIRRTEGAEEEGIIDAGWFTRTELDGEVVYPLPLLQYDWSRLRSDAWQVECLPSRRASF